MHHFYHNLVSTFAHCPRKPKSKGDRIPERGKSGDELNSFTPIDLNLNAVHPQAIRMPEIEIRSLAISEFFNGDDVIFAWIPPE